MTSNLLQRVATGDPSSLRLVMDQYGGLVWSLARRLSTSEADAEDATQEIFLDVWRSAPRFDPAVASEATFIAMIARRRLIDRARRSGRRGAVETISPEAVEAAGRDEPPAARPELADEAARAARALTQLSPEQQRVLRLSIYHGLTHEKIAEATGLPLGTVKTHARRGLIRVRELLEASGSGSGRVEVTS